VSEIVIVGAGITAAAAAAVLKTQFQVTVYEVRDHLGGNCYDYNSQGTDIHRYGAHIYHNPNKELHDWLSRYTDWTPYQHSVTAEILCDDKQLQVPFPYSLETEKVLGPLTDEQIVDVFFKGYSEKMWGRPWGELPVTIRNRVPKRQETSDFFPGQITALPKQGYTAMISRMFSGCEVLLGASPKAWVEHAQRAHKVLYCGRLDLLQDKAGLALGSNFVDRQRLLTAWLDHRTLDFTWGLGDPAAPKAVLNYCHRGNPAIRRIQHAQISGGRSKVFHMETPRQAHKTELSPFYPAPATEDTPAILAYLKTRVKELYPNLIPMGRLAQHIYMDMHAAIGKGRSVAEEILGQRI